MSVITWVQRKSRLSTLIDKPGGVSVGVALAEAKANLATLESRSREVVAERIAELLALPAPTTAEESDQLRQQAYRASSAVIDAAGPFELTDLCAAASGLCDLIDAAPAGKPFDWRIVTVHAQALQLLMSLGPDAAESKALVLDNLRLVLERKLGAASAG